MPLRTKTLSQPACLKRKLYLSVSIHVLINFIYIVKIDYSVPEEKEPESIENEIESSSSAPSASILSSDIENLKDGTFTAEKSGALKNKCQDISKLKPNKTDNNKPEYNDTDDNDPESLNKAEKENFTELNSS